MCRTTSLLSLHEGVVPPDNICPVPSQHRIVYVLLSCWRRFDRDDEYTSSSSIVAVGLNSNGTNGETRGNPALEEHHSSLAPFELDKGTLNHSADYTARRGDAANSFEGFIHASVCDQICSLCMMTATNSQDIFTKPRSFHGLQFCSKDEKLAPSCSGNLSPTQSGDGSYLDHAQPSIMLITSTLTM